jgi:hypothetical protein
MKGYQEVCFFYPALQIMVLATFLPLVAGRFGLAPTSRRHADTGLRLQSEDKAVGLYSADPAGESWVGERWAAAVTEHILY